jgi:TonB family protein
MKTLSSFSKSNGLRLCLAIPIIFLGLAGFSLNAYGQKTTKEKIENAQPATNKDGMTDGAYQQVDEMPVYKGGDQALLDFIATHTSYPKDAKEQGIQGKVITRFKVKADGSVDDVSVVKGVNASLDAEAIRVVELLPNFTPGKLKGKEVAVWFMVPITFALK